MTAHSLTAQPVHLGRNGTATAQPIMTGPEWYADYETRTAADGADGRLVSLHSFSESWTSWEMHPQGEEVVICTAGTITLIQQRDGGEQSVVLHPGDYAINPAGIWHTADVAAEATALFITVGAGTEHRPR